MTTTDQVLLIILTSLLSLFFILCAVLIVALIKLLKGVQRVVDKAEGVVDSVESAAEVLKDTGGRLALFKLIRNIIKLTKKDRK